MPQPPLSVSIDDDHRHSSVTYSDDEPLDSATDSLAPLIVHHNDEEDEDERDHDERPSELDIFTDSDDNDDLDDSLSPLYHINGKLSIPPLSPFTIFVYLLSPYLKLGALLLPYYQLPLKYGLSSILVCALLALVARHLLYLIARYLRKADLEDVFSDTFVSAKKRGSRIERRRELFRMSVKVGTATLRIFLTVVYLQECVHLMLPLFSSPPALQQSATKFVLALTMVLLAMALSYPGSLASRLVICTTYLSILTYLLWLSCIAYLHAHGILTVNPNRSHSQNIWYGLVATSFIFTSSNTLPLYASIKGTIQSLLFHEDSSLPIPASGVLSSASATLIPRGDGGLRQPWYRSFKILSLLSVTTALGLILPLVVFAAFPNEIPASPVVATVGSTEMSTPATRIQTYVVPTLAALTLLFATPQLLITIPPSPAGSFKWLSTNSRRFSAPGIISKVFTLLKKSAIGLLVIVLTFTCIILDTSYILRSITAIMSILATYYLSSVLHVLTHTFKSPLSIILPSTYFSSSHSVASTPLNSDRSSTGLLLPPPVPGPSTSSNIEPPSSMTLSLDTNDIPAPATTGFGHPTALARHRHTRSQQVHDDLLQRKERSLQKRQMRRRIIWDMWAWSIFFGGFVVVILWLRMGD
ncbi:hypothetical protein AGABI2DRAFT_119635 [Agaricus bisporus var. bisporus H97]|uniref:hypothetical protein n=1 Tax=Agaricus bisporus var. bisporus (strain H97 / ATCC MYA-4626 / FGSC 10389) TaxID=936046 RepID=UPI00029F7D43|nr:hypothetical protein AGABI2DRAFT_119635 [Agaricus bisporus var. bisporus H97]EKV45974.1 hypothetical protein AGABI2DRAFT_119635 [Agaricus bisporus var. bisporus H97]